MAKGRATERVKCPNHAECGGYVTVTFNWWDYPETWGYYGGSPRDEGFEIEKVEKCDECDLLPEESELEKPIANLEFNPE